MCSEETLNTFYKIQEGDTLSRSYTGLTDQTSFITSNKLRQDVSYR